LQILYIEEDYNSRGAVKKVEITEVQGEEIL